MRIRIDFDILCVLLTFVAECLCHESWDPSETSLHSTIDFDFHRALVPNDVYVLWWKFDENYITFEVQAQTTGYVGFGISPSGSMVGADLVIGAVSGDQTDFMDYHSTQNEKPTADPRQDWVLQHSAEANGYTTLRFARSLTNCDDDDLDITADTLRVIYSWGSSDTVSYHGANRGTASITLLDYAGTPPTMPGDAWFWDLLNDNYNMPNVDTTYFCRGFTLPAGLTQKNHIIKAEPIIDTGSESYVHHMVLYGCDGTLSDGAMNTGSDCWSGEHAAEWYTCNMVFLGWAIGGRPFFFPSHVGFPVGEPGSTLTHFRLEYHYDNPGQDSGVVDSSGLRLTLTPTLRDNDAGFIQSGISVDDRHIIPPYADSFMNYGWCLDECLSEALTAASNTEGIHVFASFLHSHTVGVSLRVRHYRAGVELPILAQDNYYDFDFQETKIHKEETLIKPGDEWRVECDSNTSGKTTVIYGGPRSADEMCLAYILYYPKLSLSMCETVPTEQSLLEGTISATGSYVGDDFIVETPAEYNGQTLDGIIPTLDWTDVNVRDLLETAGNTGTVEIKCADGGNTHASHSTVVNVPTITQPWNPLDEDDEDCTEVALPSSASCTGLHMLLPLFFSMLLTIVL